MQIRFHTKCLPTARLVWHCPYIIIYSSDDREIQGKNYREYALIRLDGENWESDTHVANMVEISHTGAFVGWNTWKEKNREGLDCQVGIQRVGNIVTMATENLGIKIASVTTVKDEVEELYVALTGDQCALTNILINRKNSGHKRKVRERCSKMVNWRCHSFVHQDRQIGALFQNIATNHTVLRGKGLFALMAEQ